VDADIFRDLKHLDERLQTVDHLLESCAELFEKHYSEFTSDSKKTYSWPYCIRGKSAKVDWPDYKGEVRKKLSPPTSALCGWAVSRLSSPGNTASAPLRDAATQAAAKLAQLPRDRIKSKTFTKEGEIFLEAQVLRFLASQNESKGELFKNILDSLHESVAHPSQILHPFHLHYCVLALEQVRLVTGIKTAHWYGDKFRDRVHTEIISQISYASSLDESRLDIGALAYALAAALRVGSLRLTTPLARKALAIIFEHQRGGRWSEIQPISRTVRGFVHFPLKIEIANAVLSILMPEIDAEVSTSWVQIDEMMDWVAGTVNRVGPYSGWCSEHDFASDRIDFWVTAQVVQFLLDYRELRRRLVIRASLERAGLVTVHPAKVATTWKQLSPTDLGKPIADRIKTKLETNFVSPFKEKGTLKASSLLLYGPPGTSKTSTMEALANRLEWQFLQITPADFLLAGEEQVEARATLLFEILKRAKNFVVLFDEVDEFLLDREAEGRPGGIFRFMTTSMLPKLQSLKTRRRLIFGIATNYKERLDKAITRLGRVDDSFAILPPDFKSRIALIESFQDRTNKKKSKTLAANTPLFSYLELRRVVSEKGEDDPWKIIPHPTASLEAYSNRPGAEEEFGILLAEQITDSVIAGAKKRTKDQLKTPLKRLVEKIEGQKFSEQESGKQEARFSDHMLDQLKRKITDLA
jgi:hypothetical protein